MILRVDESNAGRLRRGFTGILLVGALALAYNFYDGYGALKELKESKVKFDKEIVHPVVNYFDRDSNGLSFYEDYKIKGLMGIQDSSQKYLPTQKDWKRAHKKIFKK